MQLLMESLLSDMMFYSLGEFKLLFAYIQVYEIFCVV